MRGRRNSGIAPMPRKRYRDAVIDAMQRSTWMPAVRHLLHQDDVPDDIDAVIIDNVLNGLEVYGSGRRLA